MASKTQQYTVSVKVIGEQNLAKLRSQMDGLQATTRKLGTAKADLAAGGSAFQKYGNQVQNASYQLTDFIVQVQGGTSASRAFAQQAPQLLGAFGALGAALGLVAALAPAAIQAIKGMGENTMTAAEAAKKLNDAYDKLENLRFDGQLAGLAELQDKWGGVIALQEEYYLKQVEEAARAMANQGQSLNQLIGQYETAVEEAARGNKAAQETVNTLKQQIAVKRAMIDLDYSSREALAESYRVTVDMLEAQGALTDTAREQLALFAEEQGILQVVGNEIKVSADEQERLTRAINSMLSTNASLSTQVGILEDQAKALENGADAALAAAAATKELALARQLAGALEGDGIITPEEQAALWDYEDLLNRQADAQARITTELNNRREATRAASAAQKEDNEQIKELAKLIKEAGDRMKEAEDEARKLSEAIGTGVGTALGEMVVGIKSFEDGVKEMAKVVITEFAKIAAQAAALKLTRMFSPGFTPNAHGNVFQGGNIVPFARGGVVTGPTLFPMNGATGLMGEAGPEAIVPLRRTAQGDLGVQAQAPVINIVNNSSAQVSARSTSGGTEITIDEIRRVIASDIRRGGNGVAAAFEGAYKVSRGR